jgi:hypothetical protein
MHRFCRSSAHRSADRTRRTHPTTTDPRPSRTRPPSGHPNPRRTQGGNQIFQAPNRASVLMCKARPSEVRPSPTRSGHESALCPVRWLSLGFRWCSGRSLGSQRSARVARTRDTGRSLARSRSSGPRSGSDRGATAPQGSPLTGPAGSGCWRWRGKPVGDVVILVSSVVVRRDGGERCRRPPRWRSGWMFGWMADRGRATRLTLARTVSWSGYMMMDGVHSPGLDSHCAGARPFNLLRPPVTRSLPAGTRVTV